MVCDQALDSPVRFENSGQEAVQLVNDNSRTAAGRTGCNPEPGISPCDMGHAKSNLHRKAPHKPREGCPELTARCELVIGTAAEGFLRVVSAQEPDRLRSRDPPMPSAGRRARSLIRSAEPASSRT